jgi:hypothetical protein
MDCVSSMKIKVRPRQTLESFVACWHNLDMACPQHDPTNSVVLTPTPHLKQESQIVVMVKKWFSMSILFLFSDSSMHIGSTNVALGHVYSLACQHHLILHKKSTTYAPIISMSWIIVYTNYIFSLYAFPSARFEDDDKCNDNFITNGWIFNTPFCVFFNSFFTFVVFNNFASSSYLLMCSLLYVSFSFALRCSLLIKLSPRIMLWTPKLQKHA